MNFEQYSRQKASKIHRKAGFTRFFHAKIPDDTCAGCLCSNHTFSPQSGELLGQYCHQRQGEDGQHGGQAHQLGRGGGVPPEALGKHGGASRRGGAAEDDHGAVEQSAQVEGEENQGGKEGEHHQAHGGRGIEPELAQGGR